MSSDIGRRVARGSGVCASRGCPGDPPRGVSEANDAEGGEGAASATPPANRRTGNIGLIAAGNLAGVPAIFFPCGFGTDGLPVGLQLVGPPFSEPLLVALASAYQRETDHHMKRPKD